MQDLFNADCVLVKIMYRNRWLNCIYLLIYGSVWLHYKIGYFRGKASSFKFFLKLSEYSQFVFLWAVATEKHHFQ
jgi:hypothetical protein